MTGIASLNASLHPMPSSILRSPGFMGLKTAQRDPCDRRGNRERHRCWSLWTPILVDKGAPLSRKQIDRLLTRMTARWYPPYRRYGSRRGGPSCRISRTWVCVDLPGFLSPSTHQPRRQRAVSPSRCWKTTKKLERKSLTTRVVKILWPLERRDEFASLV